MAETFGNTPGLLNPIFQRPYPELPPYPPTQLGSIDEGNPRQLFDRMRTLESDIQQLRTTTEQVFGMSRFRYDDGPRAYAYYTSHPDFWPPAENHYE